MATPGLHAATATLTLRPTVSFSAIETEVKRMNSQDREHYIKKLKEHLRLIVPK
jgi:uncharacterized protein YfdQ (DUF2303 family)